MNLEPHPGIGLLHHLKNHHRNDLSTMTQVAAFLKHEAKEDFTQFAKSHIAAPYTPENFRQKGDSVALANEFAAKCRNYCIRSEQLEMYKTTTSIGGLVLSAGGPLSIPIIGGLLVYENKQSKDLEKLKAEITKLGLETARRLEWNQADYARLRAMPIHEREAAVKAFFEHALWANVDQAGHISDQTRAEFSRVFAHNLHMYENLKREDPRLSTEEFFRGITKAVEVAKKIEGLPVKLKKDAASMREDSQATRDEMRAINKRMNRLERGSKEQRQMMRFMLDVQYKNLTIEEKIAGIKNELYPDKIGELKTLELLNRWENREKKWMDYTNTALIATDIARKIGVRVPRDLEKGIVAAQHGFSIVMGISTGNPAQIIQGITNIAGIFKKTGPDIHAIYQQQLLDSLATLHQDNIVIMEMIQQVQQQLIEVYELNLQIAQTVNEIGIQMIRNHSEVMAELGKIDRDVLYQHELIVHQQLEFMAEFSELKEARTVYCSNGLFTTHAQAQQFFRNNHDIFYNAITGVRDLFKPNPMGIKPILKFRSAYSVDADAQDLPGNHRRFEDEIWGSAHTYYHRLNAQERNKVFKPLFEPVIYIDSLTEYKDAVWEVGTDATHMVENCRNLLGQLIAPHIILEAGNFMAEFHRYYPLIKNFNDGTLYTINELLQMEQIQDQQLRGKKNLKRILTFTHLCILQHHLLSGGPLIPIFHTKFMEQLANHTATMNNPDTTPAQKEALQNEIQDAVNLLAFNPLFARNLMLYSLRKQLGITTDDPEKNIKCFRYRSAYNHPVDPNPLQDLFPGWEFSPKVPEDGGEHGWALKLPFKAKIGDGRAIESSLIELPNPNDLFFGRLEYPSDLPKLLQLRQRLIEEIVSYEFTKHISENHPALREAISTNIMVSV